MNGTAYDRRKISKKITPRESSVASSANNILPAIMTSEIVPMINEINLNEFSTQVTSLAQLRNRVTNKIKT